MTSRREQETLDEILKLVQVREKDKTPFDASRGGSGRKPMTDQEPLDAESKRGRLVNFTYLPSLPPAGRLRFSNRAWWSDGTVTAPAGNGPTESGEVVRHIVSAEYIGWDERAEAAAVNPVGTVNVSPVDSYSGRVFFPTVTNPTS